MSSSAASAASRKPKRKRSGGGILQFFGGGQKRRGAAAGSASRDAAASSASSSDNTTATSWACPKCTFLNAAAARDRCEMCNTRRGAGTVASAAPPAPAAAPSGKNAFAMMMERAAQRPRRERFHLQRDPASGHFSWTWTVVTPGVVAPEAATTATTDDPAWASSVTLKDRSLDQPGSIKLTANLAAAPAAPRRDVHHRLTSGQLKSALQKNVRRQRGAQAVRCAWTLMRADFTQFIRRFMIIVLEDSVLHPSMPLLAWLLLANSKGFQPPRVLLMECLRIVLEVAASDWRDPLPHFHDVDATDKDAGGEQSPLGTADCDDAEAHTGPLIRSILCRGRFGGMRGDMAMLAGYARLWKARLQGHRGPAPSLPSLPPASTGVASSPSSSSAAASLSFPASDSSWHLFIARIHDRIPRPQTAEAIVRSGVSLSPTDIPVAAIDFHCVPAITEHLVKVWRGKQRSKQAAADGTPGGNRIASPSRSGRVLEDCSDLEDRLRSAMWYFSSSVNRKRTTRTGRSTVDGDADTRRGLLPLWRQHQKEAVVFQRNYIEGRWNRR